MRTPRFGRILETMSRMRECVKIKEELEWLKVRKAGTEYSRACRKDLIRRPP